MEKESEELLESIVKSLEQAIDILDKSYKSKDFQKFNRAKSLILQLQTKISQIIK